MRPFLARPVRVRGAGHVDESSNRGVTWMFELFKVGWDLFTIRHYSRQGMKLSAGDYVVAIGFVVFLYGTAVPAAVLYQNGVRLRAFR